jgi:hypothetical protein
MFQLEVLALYFTLIGTAETSFHSEHIWDLKLPPHGDARRGLFALVHRESRRFKTEIVANFAQEVRENTGLMRHFWVVISVHKDVLLSGVTVQVTVQHNFSFFLE